MIHRWRSVAVAFALLGLMLPASEAFARQHTLNGTVSYRERIALPPSAVVEVKLVDVSLADAPARTLARASVAPAGKCLSPIACVMTTGP